MVVLLPKPKKGGLSKYGYSTKLPAAERHAALDRAVKKVKYAVLIERLNLIATLNKSRYPARTVKIRADIHYLQRKHSASKIKK